MNPILKRTLTGLTVGMAVILAVLFAPPAAIYPAVLVLALLAGMEFFVLYETKVRMGDARDYALAKRLAGYALGWAVIAAGLCTLASIPARYVNGHCGPFRLGNVMLLYVIAIVKFSDVGGFAFGLTSAKFMKGGNHKLCPSISPGKSWEGLFGSVFASCLVSCLFMGVTNFSIAKSLVCGVAAALVGTAGDLVESKFKRWVGVKDSSTMKITNGMGGFLDMLDSLFFAPVVVLAIMWMNF